MDYIKIGTIIKPQGIKGEVKVNPCTDDVSRFLKLKKVFVKRGGQMEHVRVMEAREDGRYAYLLLEKVYDRSAAELMRAAELFVDRANAVPLPEGRYFIVDLLGSGVQDQNGAVMGTLKDVLKPGANDVFVVSRLGAEDLLIPVVDGFVLDIDPVKKLITVNVDMLVEEEV